MKQNYYNNYDYPRKNKDLPRSGPLLFVSYTCLVAGLGQDLAVTNEHNMFAAELLFQFTHQPDLDLLECLQLGHGHVDDDRLKTENNY